MGLLGGAALGVGGPGVAVARHREERGRRQWVGFNRVRASILGAGVEYEDEYWR